MKQPMFNANLTFILTWWLVFFLIGLIFLPFTTRIFTRFLDRGYIFAKIFGILVLSYTLFILGTLKVLPFTHLAIVLLLITFGFLSLLLVWKFKEEQKEGLPTSWKFFIFEELLFFVCLTFWSYIRAHEPSIHGLEKFMDFGFVNSILRTEYFPAKDLWLTPLSINYYYFGQFVTAVLTKLSGIDVAVTYNLMIATLFAFTFTCAFSIGLNLISQLKTQPFDFAQGVNSKLKITSQNLKVIIIGGLLAGFLVALAGNLHTIYGFFAAYDGETPVPFWKLALDFNFSNYWYPNATRFIPFTIHEFPIYSFVVSDLHGHVLSIPIVLTIIAILLHESIRMKERVYQNIWSTVILIAFLLATAYMTNAWDGLIYFLLTSAIIGFLYFKQRQTHIVSNTTNKQGLGLNDRSPILQILPINGETKNWVIGLLGYWIILAVGSILFTLPFSLFFKPFVSGIGIICAPEFLTKIGKLGPFLFEANHCQRSPLYQLVILHGFWYFWAISFLFFLWKKGNTKYEIQNTKQADVFVLILIVISTLLLLLPEFIYAKDIYPSHYRANTMFKLGYQAFMMLGISTAYIMLRIILNIKHQIVKIFNFAFVFFIFAISFLLLVMIYPYFAINAYYGSLKVNHGLDGLVYLKALYPEDYEAILWLRDNIEGQPVILEGAGESYTDYARISANTGLPTVVGWPVHEWLWRGSYDEAGKRVAEVEQAYTITNVEQTRAFLNKYNVEYVFVGTLERQKYPNLNEEKFKTLGEPIYQNGQTTIYKVNSN